MIVNRWIIVNKKVLLYPLTALFVFLLLIFTAFPLVRLPAKSRFIEID